jgi:hypothetical protein
MLLVTRTALDAHGGYFGAEVTEASYEGAVENEMGRLLPQVVGSAIGDSGASNTFSIR